MTNTPDVNTSFEKIDALNQVAAFHRTFKHPIEEEPVIPAPSRCALRVNLLAEELKELQQAITDNDLTEIADALCDLQYVLAGAILEFGLGSKFKQLFDEVQRSNMSKVCHTLDEAKATQAHYKAQKGFDSYVVESEGQFLVYRKEDDKTLKSINYSPAKLEQIIDG